MTLDTRIHYTFKIKTCMDFRKVERRLCQLSAAVHGKTITWAPDRTRRKRLAKKLKNRCNTKTGRDYSTVLLCLGTSTDSSLKVRWHPLTGRSNVPFPEPQDLP